MNEAKFYICEKCGNLVGVIHSSGVPMMCCGQKMTPVIPGTVEASVEKHLPVSEVREGAVVVKVGSVEHPMTAEHLIEWVYLETNFGGKRRTLSKDDSPEVVFALDEGEEARAVYAYCNLHGLWKTEL